MLRIRRALDGKVKFKLSGHIEPADIHELHRLFSLEPYTARLVLNLKELVLADLAAVEFLAECEATGMSLEDCPAYVRNWIDQRGGQNK
jgi:hypothetical protein